MRRVSTLWPILILTMACAGGESAQPAATQAKRPVNVLPQERVAVSITALDIAREAQTYTRLHQTSGGWIEATVLDVAGQVRIGRGFDRATLAWFKAPSVTQPTMDHITKRLKDPIFQKLPAHLGLPSEDATPTTPRQEWTFRNAPEADVQALQILGRAGPVIAQLAEIEQLIRRQITLPKLTSVWRQPDLQTEFHLPCEIHQIRSLRPVLAVLESQSAKPGQAAAPTAPLRLAVDRVDATPAPAIRLYGESHLQRIAPDGRVSWYQLSGADQALVSTLLKQIPSTHLAALCPKPTALP